MYEYRDDPEVTYTIRIPDPGGAPTREVRLTISPFGETDSHLEQAAHAFFESLATHHDIEVTQHVRATGVRPGLVFPTG